MAKAKTAVSTENPIQTLKEATCPTSSGKSTLGYQIGIDDSGAIHLKVSSNDGGGFFSNEWVALADIQAALQAWPDDQGVTSMALRGIFQGKSANTPGFLIAVLVAEELLEPMPKKQRGHQACDPATFLASVEALRTGTATNIETKPMVKAPKAKSKLARKPAAKNPKAPRKPPTTSRKGK